jgi:hypothetical protein
MKEEEEKMEGWVLWCEKHPVLAILATWVAGFLYLSLLSSTAHHRWMFMW